MANDKEKKGFWKEFKEFITRGNILDMAVGIIVGGAFTAIVNALCNNILKPIVNWILALILGTDSLSEVYTFLTTAYTTDETGAQVIDLANSIYIDWGTCINAIINFLLTAIVLFLIIKAVMRVSKMRAEAKKAIEEAAEKRKAEKPQSPRRRQQQWRRHRRRRNRRRRARKVLLRSPKTSRPQQNKNIGKKKPSDAPDGFFHS